MVRGRARRFSSRRSGGARMIRSRGMHPDAHDSDYRYQPLVRRLDHQRVSSIPVCSSRSTARLPRLAGAFSNSPGGRRRTHISVLRPNPGSGPARPETVRRHAAIHTATHQPPTPTPRRRRLWLNGPVHPGRRRRQPHFLRRLDPGRPLRSRPHAGRAPQRSTSPRKPRAGKPARGHHAQRANATGPWHALSLPPR